MTIQYKSSVLPLCESLQTQLRSPPVSSLRVVPDFVTSFHPDPLRNRAILLLFLGQESLDSESLVRRHGDARTCVTLQANQSHVPGSTAHSWCL